MVLALRWIVGLLSVLALAGWTLLLIVGRGLASAYRGGAPSREALAELALLAGVPLLLGAMLVSVFVPHARLFLHAVAAAVAAALAGSLLVARTNPGEGALYGVFFALWMVYYLCTVWSPGP